MQENFHPFYIFTVSRRILFFLDQRRTGKVRIADLLASRELWQLLELCQRKPEEDPSRRREDLDVLPQSERQLTLGVEPGTGSAGAEGADKALCEPDAASMNVDLSATHNLGSVLEAERWNCYSARHAQTVYNQYVHWQSNASTVHPIFCLSQPI